MKSDHGRQEEEEVVVGERGEHQEAGQRDRGQGQRPKKQRDSKISTVIRRWLDNVLPTLPGLPLSQGSSLLDWSIETLVEQAPKRWVVYEPMVLLPTGSFGFQALSATTPASAVVPTSPASPTPPSTSPLLASSAPSPPNYTGAVLPLWQNVLAAVAPAQQDQLWRDILFALSPKGGQNAQLTHLAVNEGIPLRVRGEQPEGNGNGEKENILRSPTGLRPLYGDFGPVTVSIDNEGQPSEDDFARALWVSTKQNGLYQTWAPRWSMFSRGNIKEKARLLAWPADGGQDSAHGDTWAVDLYAGIGYFVFSYAQRGMRVLGWELNPWSAEALRRGAARNGWSARVVRTAADLARPTAEMVFGRNGEDGSDDNDDSPPSIVVFVEDNRNAARRLAELRHTVATTDAVPSQAAQRQPLRVLHVNCGLLPTSRDTWRTAWDAVVEGSSPGGSASDGGGGGGAAAARPQAGWLHLHENVGTADIENRKEETQALVDAWARADTTPERSVSAVVQHVELVKTFAPDVWHCVFDVSIVAR